MSSLSLPHPHLSHPPSSTSPSIITLTYLLSSVSHISRLPYHPHLPPPILFISLTLPPFTLSRLLLLHSKYYREVREGNGALYACILGFFPPWVCGYVCMYVCAWVCVCVYVCVHVCEHAYVCVCMCVEGSLVPSLKKKVPTLMNTSIKAKRAANSVVQNENIIMVGWGGGVREPSNTNTYDTHANKSDGGRRREGGREGGTA